MNEPVNPYNLYPNNSRFMGLQPGNIVGTRLQTSTGAALTHGRYILSLNAALAKFNNGLFPNVATDIKIYFGSGQMTRNWNPTSGSNSLAASFTVNPGGLNDWSFFHTVVDVSASNWPTPPTYAYIEIVGTGYVFIDNLSLKQYFDETYYVTNVCQNSGLVELPIYRGNNGWSQNLYGYYNGSFSPHYLPDARVTDVSQSVYTTNNPRPRFNTNGLTAGEYEIFTAPSHTNLITSSNQLYNLCIVRHTISIKPTPVVNITQNGPFCNTPANVILNAIPSSNTADNTYQWTSTLGSSTSQTWNVPTINTPVNSAYSLRVVSNEHFSLDFNGNFIACEATYNGNIIVSRITPSGTPSAPSCLGASDGRIVGSASGGTTPYRYEVLNASGQWVSNLTTLPAGSYTLRATDALNCVGTVAVTVPAGPTCCVIPNNGVVTPGRLYSGNNTIIGNGGTVFGQVWQINGTLTIEGVQNLNGVRMFFGEGAELIIKKPAGTSLLLSTFTSCTLTACDKMWKGIRLEDGTGVVSGGRLVLSGCLVEKAENAVTINTNTYLRTNAGKFLDNINGIYMPEASNGVARLTTFLMAQGSEFSKTTRAFPQPYQGQTTHNGRYERGIFLNDALSSLSVNYVLGGTSTPRSLFKGLGYGIELNDVTFASVRNALFQDIVNVAGTDWGKAIKSTASGISHLDVVGNGIFSGTARALMFNNCGVGLYTSGANLVSMNNADMLNVGIGASINNVWNANLGVNSCKVENCKEGITFKGVGLNTYRVNSNLIINAGQGIAVYDIFGVEGGNRRDIINNNISLIGNTVASSNPTDPFLGVNTTGIYLQNAVKWSVSNNTVTMPNGLTNTSALLLSGIGLEGGSGHKVNCNSVLAGADNPARTSAFAKTVGIRMNQSPSNIIACNITKQTATGIAVLGDCNSADIKSNELNRHDIGIDYSVTGKTDRQLNKGNKWTYMTNPVPGVVRFGARHAGPFATQNLSTYFTNNTATFKPTLPTTNLGWFQNSTALPAVCYQNGDGCGIAAPAFTGDGQDQTYDELVANGLLPTALYPDEETWLAERNLAEKIKANPGLLTDNPDLATFWAQIQSKGFWPLMGLADNKKDLLSVDAATEVASTQLQAQMDELLVGIDSLQNLLSDGTLTGNDEVQALAELTQLSSDLDSLAMSYQVQEQANKAQNDADIQMLKAEADGLATPSNFEEYEQQVHQILFGTLLKNLPLSEEQKNTIDGIAFLCPVLGGPIVFAARSIQASYMPVQYDDITLCEKQEVAYLTTRGNIKVEVPTIVPNPNAGYANIVLPETLDTEIVMQIFDLNGKMVWSTTIAKGTHSQFVDLTSLTNGTYLYRSVGVAGTVTNGKLVLAKY